MTNDTTDNTINFSINSGDQADVPVPEARWIIGMLGYSWETCVTIHIVGLRKKIQSLLVFSEASEADPMPKEDPALWALGHSAFAFGSDTAPKQAADTMQSWPHGLQNCLEALDKIAASAEKNGDNWMYVLG